MDRIDMIFDMLKDLDGKTDVVRDSQIRVEADLKYHIKRTDLIEDAMKRAIRKPTLRQVATFLGIIATIVGTIATLVKLGVL